LKRAENKKAAFPVYNAALIQNRRAADPARGLRLLVLYVVWLKKSSGSPLPYGDQGYNARYQNHGFHHNQLFL